jgi:hypothetical protein
VIFLSDFSFVRIFLRNYRVTMTTTLDTSCLENTIGFVSKARVSACMYFLVVVIYCAILNLHCNLMFYVIFIQDLKMKKTAKMRNWCDRMWWSM